MTVIFKLKDKGKKSTVHFLPPIPLQKPEKKALEAGEYHMYKLCNSSPTERLSPIYELSVPYFGTSTCKEYMKFCSNFDKVYIGQNITTTPGWLH